MRQRTISLNNTSRSMNRVILDLFFTTSLLHCDNLKLLWNVVSLTVPRKLLECYVFTVILPAPL